MLIVWLRKFLRTNQLDIILVQHIRHECQCYLLCHLATGALRFISPERPESRMPLVPYVVHEALCIELKRVGTEVLGIYVQQSSVEKYLVSLPQFEALQLEVLSDIAN